MLTFRPQEIKDSPHLDDCMKSLQRFPDLRIFPNLEHNMHKTRMTLVHQDNAVTHDLAKEKLDHSIT